MLQSDFFFYLVVVLVIIIAVLLLLLTHAGFFYTLRIRTVRPPVLPHHIAYTLRTGAYKNVGPVFRKLSTLAPKTKLFGIYYDDPNTVSHVLSRGARDSWRVYVGTSRKAKIPCGLLSARPTGED